MWRLSSLTLMAILVPLAASAADVTFDVTGAVDYDSNVFRRDSSNNGSRNVKEDVLFRLRPGVEIHEDRGEDVSYSLKYTLPVEISSQYSQLDDVDHRANGEVIYHPTDRVEIFARDRFGYLRSTLVNRQVGATAQVESGRDRVTVNAASLGARYLFTPRLSGKIEASHRLFNTTRGDRQDNQTATLALDSFYTINSRHQAGLGARYTWQHFEESDEVVRSESNSVNVFVQWRWQIDETTGFDAAVGPSFIRIEQGPAGAITTPNPFPPPPDFVLRAAVSDQTDKSVDLFAQVGLIKRWTPTLNTGVRYIRAQGTASGVGGSVISDSVVATIDWKFRERWELTFRGDYVRRESVSSVTRTSDLEDSRLENNRFGATLRLAHRLARKSRIFGQVLYNNQTSDSNFASSSDFEGWIVTLGFTHVFEPIKLW